MFTKAKSNLSLEVEAVEDRGSNIYLPPPTQLNARPSKD